MTASSVCAPVRARFSRFVDRRLAARAELLVRRHLAGCGACRAELRRARALGRAVAELPFDPPVGLAARVRSTERRRARAVGLRRGVARIAAAVVVFSAATFAGLAGLQVVRGAAPVTPRLAAPSSAPAVGAAPVAASPARLRRVSEAPALAEWARVREAEDAAEWLATEGEIEAPAPSGPRGATAGFRAPR